MNVSPHDLDAERAVLGAVLVRNEALPLAESILNPDDFFRHEHTRLFSKMLTVSKRGEAVDYLTLSHALRQTDLEKVGGPAYIAGLLDGVPHSTNVEHYAKIVKEKARARRVIAFAQQAIDTFSADPAAVANGAGERFAAAVRAAIDEAHAGPKVALKAFTMGALAAHTFQHRRALLTRCGMPILREGHLAEVYATRGHGKTWFVNTLGIVAATGTDALGFSAPEPCRVLCIDGEMASEELQTRQGELGKALNVLDTDNLVTLASDWQDGYMPRLDTAEGQAAVEPYVANADLVIIDNRSALFDPEGEKDPTAWQPAQDWLLSLRRRGKAVVLVHHSNRQGGARGHSKPEDVMNLLIKLTRPEDYHADQGARFKVEFEKTRGAYGSAVMPFTTRLTGSGWEIEADDTGNTGSTGRKLREYLQLANAAGERPRSANAAIRAAHVSRNDGLRTWAEMLERLEIVKHADGGFVLSHD